MDEAANNLEFEKAARLRDRIAAVEQILERQKIVNTTTVEDMDVIAFAAGADNTVAQVFLYATAVLLELSNWSLRIHRVPS